MCHAYTFARRAGILYLRQWFRHAESRLAPAAAVPDSSRRRSWGPPDDPSLCARIGSAYRFAPGNGASLMHSVLLSDDHHLLLRGLQDILGAEQDFQIIGATTRCAKALSLVSNSKPDIDLLDMALPDVGGLDILLSCHDYGWPV